MPPGPLQAECETFFANINIRPTQTQTENVKKDELKALQKRREWNPFLFNLFPFLV